MRACSRRRGHCPPVLRARAHARTHLHSHALARARTHSHALAFALIRLHARALAQSRAENVASACPSCRLHILHNVPNGDADFAAASRFGARVHYVAYSSFAQPVESPHNFRHRALVALLRRIQMADDDCAFMLDGDAIILRDLGSLCSEAHSTGGRSWMA